MNTDQIYSITKGNERVSLADKESAMDLWTALGMLDCTETVNLKNLTGNKEQLAVFQIGFLDKAIKVITLSDAEKVLHWMLALGCTKVSIERLGESDDRNSKKLQS